MSYTNKLATLCTVASLFLWCSCTDDSDSSGGINGGDAYITFGTQIGSVAAATRAVDQSWSAGDEVGVFMTLGNYDIVDDATNKLYTAEEKGDAWRLVASGDDNKLYYPSAGSVRFIAYYPYKENIRFTDDASATYKVILDEQTNSPEFDLLWYKDESIDGLFNKESAASLQFEHQLCKIVVNVSTKGFSADDLVVGITNVPTTADFNIKTGVLSNIGDKDDVTLAAVTTNTDDENPDEEEGLSNIAVSLTYQGILVPHDAGGDYASRNLTFAFTDPVTGEEVEFTHLLKETGDEAHHFKQNTISTYTVTLTRKEVTFDNVTIINWGDGNKEDIDFVNPELKVEPESNCYILKPEGKEIYIPISRPYSYAELYDADYENELNDITSFEVGVLWSDKLATTLIDDIYLLGSDRDGAIYIKSNNNNIEGNAVVYLKDAVNDKILWSWHIWVVDYESTVTSVGGVNFMSRSLGAINEIPQSIGAMGLFYQWGRKDPFPGSSSTEDNILALVYYEGSDTPTSLKSSESQPLGISITESLSVPHIFLYGKFDWACSDDVLSSDRALRWGPTLTYDKAFDDPCPDGYRVPTKAQFVDADLWGNRDGTFNLGWTFGSSWWGAFGSIAWTGKPTVINEFKSRGYIWTRTEYDSNEGTMWNISWVEAGIATGFANYIANGMSVRCTPD